MRFLARLALLVAFVSIIVGIVAGLLPSETDEPRKLMGQTGLAYLRFSGLCVLFAIAFLLDALVGKE